VETVLENIKGLMDMRSQRDSCLPRVEIDMVAMRSNLDEVPAVVEAASELGIGRVNVRRMYSMHATRAGEAGPRLRQLERIERESLAGLDRRVVEAAFRRASLLASERGVELSLPAGGEGGRLLCPWPWMHTYIDYEGYVTPCCVCPDKDEVCFGNIFEDGFSTIWNGEGYQDLRGRMREGKPPGYCNGCVRAINEGLSAR